MVVVNIVLNVEKLVLTAVLVKSARLSVKNVETTAMVAPSYAKNVISVQNA